VEPNLAGSKGSKGAVEGHELAIRKALGGLDVRLWRNRRARRADTDRSGCYAPARDARSNICARLAGARPLGLGRSADRFGIERTARRPSARTRVGRLTPINGEARRSREASTGGRARRLIRTARPG